MNTNHYTVVSILLLSAFWIGYFCHSVEPLTVVETVEVVVEVPVETPVELREFRSETELRNWLSSRTIFLNPSYDCDDFTRVLIGQAEADGYRVAFQLCEGHALANTIINENIYFIEPQDNTYWKIGGLD